MDPFFANPRRFMRLSAAVLPWAAASTLVLGVVGLSLGLFAAPPDYIQGEGFRIMYVHVPSAWMALFCYVAMATASGVGLIWKHPLADMAAKATAPIGACFTFLALVTGSLWAGPCGTPGGCGTRVSLRCWCCFSSISVTWR